MFTHEEIQSLNDLEMSVYNYIIKNKQKVSYMKIRELADEAHVSTTTILCMCKKFGCEGYSEFKLKFKQYLKQEREQKEDVDFSLWEKMSDCNISYYLPNRKVDGIYQITSQVPVICVIEMLALKLYRQKET